MKTFLLLLFLFHPALLSCLPAADTPPGGPMIGTLPAGRVLFLGNSLTLHGPAPEIGWNGNWGMAASAEEKDYVHLLTADLAAAAGAKLQTMVRNIAGFERGYEIFDCTAGLKEELAFQAQIAIVAIGENVPALTSPEAQTRFASAFAKLLSVLKENGQPAIFVRSCFWPDEVKDRIMETAAAQAGAVFVNIAALGREEANAARAERKIDHPGVAGHPGDRGMKALAEALFAAIINHAGPQGPDRLIGYSLLRTNLPDGRHANTRTMRAMVIKADGSGQRELAPELVTGADTSTQFAGWSPDGKLAVIHQNWKSPDNARWEEENKTFRFTKETCLLDSWLIDPVSGKTENITAVDRVSFYNSGVFFWPNAPSKLGFTALIDGNSHPFRMDRDGRNKTDLTSGSAAFSYGFSSSRDGRRIAWHQNYQIVTANADGSNAVEIQTGNPFNFGPVWSPDGQWLLFVSGEHYHCHPHIVKADGTGFRKLADRGGYRGVIEFLDVPDFHGGSSDTPVWSTDSRHVFYTAAKDGAVELFMADLDGRTEQLTTSPEGTLHYHPQPSPGGGWLVYGAKRSGVRQLFLMRLADRATKQLTSLTEGSAAMWPHWQPAESPPKPHIILCMTDDQGWGDTGYNGLTKIKTPNIDAMAAAGLRLDRFYAQQTCSPTRAAIMTGRHPNRMGVFWPGMPLRNQETTIAQAAKRAGYVTGHFGKWHLNGVAGPGKVIPDSDPLSPRRCGFDESFSVSNYFETNWTFGRNGVAEKVTGDGSEAIVAEALKFIRGNAEKQQPALTVIWFGSPHVPHQPLPADLAAAGGSGYFGELTAVDRSIGTLRKGLRDLGIAENTILWYNSDNGGWTDPAKPDAHGVTGGLRGRKGDLWEGGIRVPCVIEWPARIKTPATSTVPAGVVDIFPTLTEIMQVPNLPQVPLDGISLVPLIDGQMKERPRPLGFWQARGGKDLTIDSGPSAWRDNRYKLVKTGPGNFELYDLTADPAEQANLASQQPETVDRMKSGMEQWQRSVLQSLQGADYPEPK